MRFKQHRLGPLLHQRAVEPGFLQQAHIVYGGTGAVGGATVLQLIDMFEEALATAGRPASPDECPRVIVTGRTRQELRQFTSRLFRIQQRDHGRIPEHIPKVGYVTVGGVLVELTRVSVDPTIRELADFSVLDEETRRTRIESFLAMGGLNPDAPLAARVEVLRDAVDSRVGQPFSTFARRVLENRGLPGGHQKFRSVVVGIPLASVATYKLRDLEAAATALGLPPSSVEMEDLKASYLRAMRDDLARVSDDLAEEVLIAHTTAVGGMYDEEDGERPIRIGFAHSALGDRLRDKQLFAETLTELYAERGIKMLITAAAIGIDAIQVNKAPPVNPAIRNTLRAVNATREFIPDSELSTIRVYPPNHFALCNDDDTPFSYRGGTPLEIDFVVKSGENGFFTVSNADALYRVMKVTSGSELGHVLARVAMFGDHEHAPLFRDNVYYFTETDNSRQVFDLLWQPELRQTQLSGLQPKALQDLGSAKHQGELHTLGLFTLWHRLSTLSLDAVPPRVDLRRFDAAEFFEENSGELTLEHVLQWEPIRLARLLSLLVTAKTVKDLAQLKRYYQGDETRRIAAEQVLEAVLHAVWAIPSLGTPFVMEDQTGARSITAGPYAAPIDRALLTPSSLIRHLREEFDAHGSGDDDAFQRFVEFHIANFGFVDLRPVAVLVTARSADEDLSDKVKVFRDEDSFLDALDALPPYSYFATSGLIAVLARLRGLWRRASELQLRLGSDNEFRASIPRDAQGRPLLVPSIVETFRMVSEGLEKNTGFERVDGRWGYGAR
jgi:hypothetical protein